MIVDQYNVKFVYLYIFLGLLLLLMSVEVACMQWVTGREQYVVYIFKFWVQLLAFVDS